MKKLSPIKSKNKMNRKIKVSNKFNNNKKKIIRKNKILLHLIIKTINNSKNLIANLFKIQ